MLPMGLKQFGFRTKELQYRPLKKNMNCAQKCLSFSSYFYKNHALLTIEYSLFLQTDGPNVSRKEIAENFVFL